MITPQLLVIFGNLLISAIEGIIGLRVLLKLMGASTVAPFVQWVYNTSKPLLYPFEGMFPSSQVAGAPFTIEFSALFALFVYVFIGYVLQETIYYVQRINYQHKRKDQKDKKDAQE
jgi:uncharacterized protein YggT (Ycf19 family)